MYEVIIKEIKLDKKQSKIKKKDFVAMPPNKCLSLIFTLVLVWLESLQSLFCSSFMYNNMHFLFSNEKLLIWGEEIVVFLWAAILYKNI